MGWVGLGRGEVTSGWLVGCVVSVVLIVLGGDVL